MDRLELMGILLLRRLHLIAGIAGCGARSEWPGKRCPRRARDDPDQSQYSGLGPGCCQSPYTSSVTTTTVGAPPELIDVAWANASLPLEAAVALSASIVGKLTSEIR